MALWDEHPGWTAALRPLAWIYGLGWWLLKLCRPARAWRAPVPVVSVGNLSVGGTGKSPLVQALVRRALRQGRRPAVLLRGYRAAPGPRPLAVSIGRASLAGLKAAGDEAREHALQPGAAVWVDSDRCRGAQAAVEAGADSLFLDDGFQRRWQIHRDLDLLLADWAQLRAGERLLPAGPWREPWSQAALADAFLISGAPKGLRPGALLRSLPEAWQGKPVFRLDLRPKRLVAWPDGRTAALATLRRKPVAALSGLGNPARFEAALSALGATVLPWRFPDHHPFTLADLAETPAGARAIVTTRKDAQRLPQRAWDGGAVPVWVLEAEAEVSPAASFQAMLKKSLGPRPKKGRHA